ncbi:MAG: SIMPL domain-containing protein [Patescibacteria group bacterium]
MEEQKCECGCCSFSTKHKFAIVLIAVVGLVLILSLALCRDKNEVDDNYTMTVSADGEVVANPDIAVITIGVNTGEKMKVDEVVAENTAKINAIIKALKDGKVAEKDIKTISYNLYPVYDYTDIAGRTLKGYELDQQLQIKIRDMENIGGIIGIATSNGANQVSDVSFTIDDPEKLKAEARDLAIAKAKEKAKSIARTSGIDLGKLVNVYENESGYVAYDSNAMLSSKAVSGYGMGGAETVAPTIATGDTKITINVSLTYKVK